MKKSSFYRKIISYFLLLSLTVFFSYQFYESRVVKVSEREEKIEEFSEQIQNHMTLSKSKDSSSDVNTYSLAKAQLVMRGVCFIPEIDCKMPIYDGISETALKEGAGIIPGTGDLLGLPGARTIVTSHNGGHFENLFMNLPKLDIGSLFYIQNETGEILEYEVIKKDKVLADKEEEFLKNETVENPKESFVSLRTCVPIGINSHRLLLLGRLTRAISAQSEMPAFQTTYSPLEYLFLAGAILPSFLILLFLKKDLSRNKKKPL